MKQSVTVLLYLLASLSLAATAAPRVAMETSLGTIVLELHEDQAPNTTANFLQYVRDGFYDGTIFHRVIGNFMIQGGGFTEDYQRKSTREPIRNEAHNGLKNTRGTVAMARTAAPHSATAQFFINVKDNRFLDYPGQDGWGYAVFGQVVEGMEVVDAIRQTATGPGGPFPADVPRTPVVIEHMTIVETTNSKSE